MPKTERKASSTKVNPNEEQKPLGKSQLNLGSRGLIRERSRTSYSQSRTDAARAKISIVVFVIAVGFTLGWLPEIIAGVLAMGDGADECRRKSSQGRPKNLLSPQ